MASQTAAASAASFLPRLTYGFTYIGGMSRTSWPIAEKVRAPNNAMKRTLPYRPSKGQSPKRTYASPSDLTCASLLSCPRSQVHVPENSSCEIILILMNFLIAVSLFVALRRWALGTMKPWGWGRPHHQRRRSRRCRRQCQCAICAKRGALSCHAFQITISGPRAISVRCCRRSGEVRPFNPREVANRQSTRSPAQRRMIGNRQVDLQHFHDRSDQAFALAKRQSKHGA